MVDNSKSVSRHRLLRVKDKAGQFGLNLAQAQQVIYDFLLDIVKAWPAQEVVEEFRHLFIHHAESVSSQTTPALYQIILADDEVEFRHTLKRCCYILVNNWELAREFEAIQALVDVFNDPLLQRQTVSPTLKRLRRWLLSFASSQDFQDLQLFAARFAEDRTVNRPGEWVNRYTSYLLVPQYANEDNPLEQREAARVLSRRLKDRFKLDLALYTAHAQDSGPASKSVRNPTVLGDSALRLIKAIVAKRGDFSYKNLARLFLEQTKDDSYANFKASLPDYLLYTVRGNSISEQIQKSLGDRLKHLYPEHNQQVIDTSLILRTCNRVIDCLMTEDKSTPAPLFTLILSQGNSITLAIILLKLILISRGSHLYLEVRIADLIRYYEKFPHDQCNWVISFLEVFQVTFAICADNIEYSLVKVEETGTGVNSAPVNMDDLAAFRIFSRMVNSSRPETDAGMSQSIES
ncbi:MAG: hypothetical protein LVS60_00150 [Nodosilinea sp. LVE1205-7]|jgi:hypothetical protein